MNVAGDASSASNARGSRARWRLLIDGVTQRVGEVNRTEDIRNRRLIWRDARAQVAVTLDALEGM